MKVPNGKVILTCRVAIALVAVATFTSVSANEALFNMIGYPKPVRGNRVIDVNGKLVGYSPIGPPNYSSADNFVVLMINGKQYTLNVYEGGFSEIDNINCKFYATPDCTGPNYCGLQKYIPAFPVLKSRWADFYIKDKKLYEWDASQFMPGESAKSLISGDSCISYNGWYGILVPEGASNLIYDLNIFKTPFRLEPY